MTCARRLQYRSQFGALLVIYVGPDAEEVAEPLRSQPDLVVVAHATAADFLRHLFSLHYLPDVLIMHDETPCGQQRNARGLLQTLFGGGSHFDAAKMVLITAARIAKLQDVAPPFAVGAADVLLLPCAPETLAARIGQHMKAFGNRDDMRRVQPGVRSRVHYSCYTANAPYTCTANTAAGSNFANI